MKLFKVFYADDDENEIISTLFYIHEDLDACLIRSAADISQYTGQTPCMTEVCIYDGAKYFLIDEDLFFKSFFRISIFHHTMVLDVGILDGEVLQ